MSSVLDKLKQKLLQAAESREGRIATEAEETAARINPLRGEEIVMPKAPELIDPLQEAVASSPYSVPNFSMTDNASMPGNMEHNIAQADFRANQATQRASNQNLPALSGLASKAETGMVHVPDVVDADFEKVINNVQDPVTKSLMQKYGRKGLIGAGIGGLGVGYGLIPDTDEPMAPKGNGPTAEVEPPKTEEEKRELASEVSGKKPISKPSEIVRPRELKTEDSNVDALSKLMSIQFGDKTEASGARLKQLQDQSNQTRSNAEAASAIQDFADAMTGIKNYKTDKSIYERAIANADKPIEQYKQRVEAEKQDPSSAYSEGMRDYAKRFGINVQGTASGADLEKIMPQLATAYKADEDRAQRALDNQYKREDHDMDREVKKAQIDALRAGKEGDAVNKDIAGFNKDVQDVYKSRSGAIGRAAQTIRQADAIDALMATGRIEGNFQLRELASSFDSMLRGGQTAVSSINELVPHDLAGDTAKVKEWLTSDPAATDRKPLLKLMQKLTNRERGMAESQINDYITQIAAHKYPRLHDNQSFNNQLDSLGIKDQVEEVRSGKKVNQAKDYIQKLKDEEAQQGKFVTLRRKSDGLEKPMSAEQAKEKLATGLFEVIPNAK